MPEPNNYVVGKGRLYFERFPSDTDYDPTDGELYFGNTPELSLSTEEETLDHFSSEGGIREKDASVVLQNDTTISFTTDNISPENLALWFGGTSTDETVAAAAAQVYNARAVRGRFVQIGASASNPEGVAGVANVAIAGLVEGTDFTVDENTGRVEFLADAPAIDPAGEDVVITYDVVAQSQTLIIAQGTSIYGRLVFISDNPVGEQTDYTWPLVKLSSNGDYALKGDDWQAMGFSAEVLRRTGYERQYARRRPALAGG